MLAYGGISVVNAIPCWKGSSMAINLGVTEVNIIKGRELEEKDPLLLTIVSYFREKYGLEPFDVKVKSNIPRRSGLKSSSAVANAVIYEISKEFKIENINVPYLSAILSKKAGVSITGAFDDASASYYGGITFTNNKLNALKRIYHIKDDIKVVIVPRERPKNINILKLKKFKDVFCEIWSIGLKGDIYLAMKLNGILVGKILGYDFPLKNIDRNSEVLAYGISGNGPSFFAIVKEGEEGFIIDKLSQVVGKDNVVVTEAVDVDCERLPVNYKRYC